jgi:hypothetical protein
MKTKLMLFSGILFLGMLFIAPAAQAEILNNDVDILFLNQGESFGTIVVRDVTTQAKWELRIAQDHPQKNAVMAILLTAMSLNEQVRIRWETGSPPHLLRVAVNRL